MSEELIKLSDAIKAIQYSNLDTLNVEERVALIKTIPTIELKRGEWVEVQISEQFFEALIKWMLIVYSLLDIGYQMGKRGRR